MAVPLTNADTVRSFVEAIHNGAATACAGRDRPGLLQLSRIHPTGGGTIVSGRFMIGDVESMVAAALADAEAGFNCYIEPRTIRQDAPKRGSSEDTCAVFALVIDRDAYSGRAGREFADPTFRVETSPGSAHDWYILDRAISAMDAQSLASGLRAVTGADSATGKPTQPYRVAGTPNFLNAKKLALGRKPCATNFANGGPLYSADELRALIGSSSFEQPVSQITSPFETVRTGEVNPRVAKIVAAAVTATTDRSAAFCSAVRTAVEVGMTALDLESLMREHPNGCASKYLSPHDRLQQEIARVWNPHAAKVAEHEAIATNVPSQTPIAKDKTKSSPVEIFWHGVDYNREVRGWLIQDLIPQLGQGLESGQWGAGKTFIALDLAGSVMTGTPFADRNAVRRGGVLFVAAEGAGEIPVRLKGIVDHKLKPAALAASVSGKPLAADLDRLPFAWVEDCPSLKDEASFERLVATVTKAAAHMKEQFGVDLVLIVIDTLAASANFDDANDAAEGQRIMNRLNALSRRTNAFVLAVDHFGKVVETGTRGTSAKEAAADVVIAVLADRNISGAVSHTRMTVRKLRGGATGAETPFDLKVVDIGGGQSTCIIEWKSDPYAKSGSTGSRERWPKSLKIFRSALNIALAESGTVGRPFQDGPTVKMVADRHVRDEFLKAYPAGGENEQKKIDAKRQAFTRALKAARERDLICSRDLGGVDHLWLVDDRDKTHTHADGPDTS